jgi:hypothetical protein
VIRLVNQTLVELHVEEHPDRTFIGRICRGFDVPGYPFTPAGREAAPQAVERAYQLSEGVDLVHIGTYVRLWLRWARSRLRASGAGPSERASEFVVRSLRRLGYLGGSLPSLMPAVAGPTVGNEGNGGHR